MSFNCMRDHTKHVQTLTWCIAKSLFNIQILPWFQFHSQLCYWSGRLPQQIDTTASETITFEFLAQMDHYGRNKFLEGMTHIISLDYN